MRRKSESIGAAAAAAVGRSAPRAPTIFAPTHAAAAPSVVESKGRSLATQAQREHARGERNCMKREGLQAAAERPVDP